MKFLRHYIFLAISWVERRYWALSYWPRHIAGLCILLLLLFGIGTCCYGAYKGIVFIVGSASECISSLFINDEDSDADEGLFPVRTQYKFPLSDSERHPKRRPNFHKDFDHLNDVHLAAARRLGIQPLESRDDLDKQKNKLVKIHTNKYYKVDKLTKSVPYLVPKAADFLTALGKLLQEYNGTSSRFIVTSVLRTQSDVKRLVRSNRNASENSTHCFGTTVDITYSRFDVHGNTYDGKLKEDLAKALYDMQEKGYCYVKYEVKQPCFHITVRP